MQQRYVHDEVIPDEPTPADSVKCHCCSEEVTMETMLHRLDETLAGFADEKGALIPALQAAQSLFGYLPEPVLKHLSLRYRIPYSEVASVVSFYSFFSTKPRGRHVVRVCLGTACYVRGGKEVLQALKQELGIEVGQTTADRQFSLEVGRCFGACGLAPVVMIDDNVHQRVKPAAVKELLREYRSDKEVSA